MKIATIRILILFLLITSISAYSQSMITESSYLENENENEINYTTFVNKMDTGKYTMIPLYNDAKELLGYRLKPLESVKKPSDKTTSFKIELGEIVELDVIYHKHILIPITFNSSGNSKEAWLLFDTGTFIPIIITDEKFKTEIGKVESVEVNGYKISNPIIGSYGFPEVIQKYNETYTMEIGAQLKGKKIVGIMGYQLLKDYLVTIDLNNGKIYLRNHHEAQKSVSGDKVFKIDYKDDLQNIWIPVTINDIEGMAHLDTGYPSTWIEESMVQNEVNSFVIGGLDVVRQTKIKYKMAQQSQNYSNLSFPLIANIGNNLLEHFVVTIDSFNKQVLFKLNNK